MPGLVTFYYGHHLLEPLWSIGVEEVFYLIWAPLLKFIRKHILLLLFSIIIIKIILQLIAIQMDTPALYEYIVGTFCFEAMAIGGLGAYFVFNSKKDFSSIWIFNRFNQIFILIILLIFVLFHSNIENVVWQVIFKTPIISPLLIYCLFLYLILVVSLINNSVINLENKTLSYLGEISYGIYMYHMSVISVLIIVLKKFPFTLPFVLQNLLFYGLVFCAVLWVSHFSRKYFENYFMKKQVNFLVREKYAEYK